MAEPEEEMIPEVRIVSSRVKKTRKAKTTLSPAVEVEEDTTGKQKKKKKKKVEISEEEDKNLNNR